MPVSVCTLMPCYGSCTRNHVQPQPLPHVADPLELVDPFGGVEVAHAVDADPQQVGVAEAAPRAGLS
jgi:hypothetical protein